MMSDAQRWLLEAHKHMQRKPSDAEMQRVEDAWLPEAQRIVRICCDIAGMPNVARNIELTFSRTMRTTLGQATTNYIQRGGTITFCSLLFATTATEHDKVKNTVHEAAHILANLRAGFSVGHKKQWREMFLQLGESFDIFTVSRCHSVDAAHVKRRNARYGLRCGGCATEYIITANRRTRSVNNIRQDKRSYSCRNCKYQFSVVDYQKARIVE